MYVRFSRAAQASLRLAGELVAVLHHYRFPLIGEVRRWAAYMVNDRSGCVWEEAGRAAPVESSLVNAG